MSTHVNSCATNPTSPLVLLTSNVFARAWREKREQNRMTWLTSTCADARRHQAVILQHCQTLDNAVAYNYPSNYDSCSRQRQTMYGKVRSRPIDRLKAERCWQDAIGTRTVDWVTGHFGDVTRARAVNGVMRFKEWSITKHQPSNENSRVIYIAKPFTSMPCLRLRFKAILAFFWIWITYLE